MSEDQDVQMITADQAREYLAHKDVRHNPILKGVLEDMINGMVPSEPVVTEEVVHPSE